MDSLLLLMTRVVNLFVLSTVSVSNFFPRFKRVLRTRVLPFKCFVFCVWEAHPFLSWPSQISFEGIILLKYFHVLRSTRVISTMFSYEFYVSSAYLRFKVISSRLGCCNYFVPFEFFDSFAMLIFDFVFNRGENKLLPGRLHTNMKFFELDIVKMVKCASGSDENVNH